MLCDWFIFHLGLSAHPRLFNGLYRNGYLLTYLLLFSCVHPVFFSWRSVRKSPGQKPRHHHHHMHVFAFVVHIFAGKAILNHEERYVFTILFFPGLGRGLEPQ